MLLQLSLKKFVKLDHKSIRLNSRNGNKRSKSFARKRFKNALENEKKSDETNTTRKRGKPKRPDERPRRELDLKRKRSNEKNNEKQWTNWQGGSENEKKRLKEKREKEKSREFDNSRKLEPLLLLHTTSLKNRSHGGDLCNLLLGILINVMLLELCRLEKNQMIGGESHHKSLHHNINNRQEQRINLGDLVIFNATMVR